ncbi:hypothetical protein SAMN04487785_11865 [Dyella jiangningensis]|uniref:hypothetical protein n=1 Tax=Dyella sp. AtDHG13 TaxID=1938897 RepID=UPI0008837C46|nr:hypothetical protein [Dyella sp. AtDHG13]PXV53267.1 hypothetical protein BDW41_11524 [Dyella sp. AtDHG13]SDL36304.1 hypothetical protein SAMN04487785_11865 [Dyella jiangningensis]
MQRSGLTRQRQDRDRTRGLAWLDSETQEILGRRRWRQPPLTRPALTLALLIVVVLHALFALALWYEMQPRAPRIVEMNREQALIVRLIDHSSEPRIAPPPALPELPAPSAPTPKAPAARVAPVTHEPPRRDAMVVQDHQAVPATAATVATPSSISLFAKDGSIRIPPSTASSTATASASTDQAKPADDRQIMQHDSNRMKYKATRFEKYFPPPNETAGGAVGRHIGDVINEVVKSTCDPAKRSTATNLLCGAPPLPPSEKNKDERLNLPPAPLVRNPNPPATPPLSSCIDEYRAGKPLSYGCPVDTPDLAFKAEMRECIDLYRAGKRLKTWCPADTARRAAAEPPAAASSAGAP